ncbi:MAG TPA: histidine kinase [Methylomirabilota bacterium]|jgi:two-component system LytT family sensor kinase|nr:histidine kinase [Methylomirabilota bacterium]
MTRSGRNVRVALAAASFLALLEIFRTGMTRILEGNYASVFDLIHWVVPLWLGVVLVSPWCAVMAWRFPVRSGQVLRTLLAHVGGAAVFVALHLAVLSAFHLVMATTRLMPRPAHLAHTYVFYIGMEASVYGAIVVVIMLLEARREAAERRVAAARLEQSLADARLESLQAQIRPHFLFNTLNALAVLARRGDGAAVDRAIGDLGDLLRASFASPGRHEITLGEELELVERYLGLQRIRFPDRLRVEWDVAPETKSALVPALLVQPLVENAIEHGLASTLGGRVRVRARRAGSALELEVDDDGPGFDGAAGQRNGGVGLANTRERLALLHGTAATLECSNPPEGGGRVRIRLPWRDGSAGAAS